MQEKKLFQLDPNSKSLAQQVFRTLRTAIFDGTLKSGENLRQENIAKELGVSQTTVRDALNRLVGEGLAARVPYKGVHVILLSSEDLKDIYEMRAILEGIAAREATKHIDAETLAEMRQLLPTSFVTEDQDSVTKAREVNRKFHDLFIQASQRQYLIRMLHQLWNWIDPQMLYSRTTTLEIGVETRVKWGQQDRYQHTRLLEALEAGDSEKANQVATEAVFEAWDNLSTIIFDNQHELTSEKEI